jgi:predicted Fe-Mo cluster-binding NifX family protein
MRIAIPTNDGTSVADHFGQSRAFLIFEVDGGGIKSSELRPHGGCGHDSHAAGGGSHAGITATLEGCDVVLCGGIGAGAIGALKAAGVGEIKMTGGGEARTVVEAYLAGTLQESPSRACRCSH